MSIDQFVFPDVCVAVRSLRSGSLHFIIENFRTKKSIKMTQVLIEHEGTDSLFFFHAGLKVKDFTSKAGWLVTLLAIFTTGSAIFL